MSFIRVKTISGARYAYEVENYWTDKGSRQRTKQYLGRILKPELVRTYDLELQGDEELPEIVHKLARHALITHGFEQEGPHLVHKSVRATLSEGTFISHDKPAVIEMNEGFLCKQTFEALRDYTPTEKRFEKKLATLVLGAGLAPAPEFFVYLFEAAKKRAKNVESSNQADATD